MAQAGESPGPRLMSAPSPVDLSAGESPTVMPPVLPGRSRPDQPSLLWSERVAPAPASAAASVAAFSGRAESSSWPKRPLPPSPFSAVPCALLWRRRPRGCCREWLRGAAAGEGAGDGLRTNLPEARPSPSLACPFSLHPAPPPRLLAREARASDPVPSLAYPLPFLPPPFLPVVPASPTRLCALGPPAADFPPSPFPGVRVAPPLPVLVLVLALLLAAAPRGPDISCAAPCWASSLPRLRGLALSKGASARALGCLHPSPCSHVPRSPCPLPKAPSIRARIRGRDYQGRRGREWGMGERVHVRNELSPEVPNGRQQPREGPTTLPARLCLRPPAMDVSCSCLFLFVPVLGRPRTAS